jgi:hypothetical protein
MRKKGKGIYNKITFQDENDSLLFTDEQPT